MKRALTSRDWFGKACAGLVLGFLFAVGVAGLIRAFAPADEPFFSTRGQFAMWMMAPVWSLAVSLCFLFRSTLSAWAGLATANILLWAIVLLLGGVLR